MTTNAQMVETIATKTQNVLTLSDLLDVHVILGTVVMALPVKILTNAMKTLTVVIQMRRALTLWVHIVVPVI